MNLLETALYWHAQNVATIPCLPKSKLPIIGWGKYQNELPTQLQVEQWFNRTDLNLALVCGGTGRLTVLDFDDIEKFLEFEATHPFYANTFQVNTARGVHLYYRTLQPVASKHFDNCELRAQGNYILTPPSIHPTGYEYRFENESKAILELTERGIKILFSEDKPSYFSAPLITETKPVEPSSTDTPNTRQSTPSNGEMVGYILTHLPILKLVSQYTQGRVSSSDGRWLLARCPFSDNHAHQDRNPSFWIDTLRNKCGCFSPKCNAGQIPRKSMSVIDLYARVELLSNRDAIINLFNELSQEELKFG